MFPKSEAHRDGVDTVGQADQLNPQSAGAVTGRAGHGAKSTEDRRALGEEDVFLKNEPRRLGPNPLDTADTNAVLVRNIWGVVPASSPAGLPQLLKGVVALPGGGDVVVVRRGPRSSGLSTPRPGGDRAFRLSRRADWEGIGWKRLYLPVCMMFLTC